MASVACRLCRHRETTKDGGSRCRHPATQPVFRHVPPVIQTWIEAHGAALPLSLPALQVIGEPLAVEAGLFAWPFHFDPAQVTACSGFAGE